MVLVPYFLSRLLFGRLRVAMSICCLPVHVFCPGTQPVQWTAVGLSYAASGHLSWLTDAGVHSGEPHSQARVAARQQLQRHDKDVHEHDKHDAAAQVRPAQDCATPASSLDIVIGCGCSLYACTSIFLISYIVLCAPPTHSLSCYLTLYYLSNRVENVLGDVDMRASGRRVDLVLLPLGVVDTVNPGCQRFVAGRDSPLRTHHAWGSIASVPYFSTLPTCVSWDPSKWRPL